MKERRRNSRLDLLPVIHHPPMAQKDLNEANPETPADNPAVDSVAIDAGEDADGLPELAFDLDSGYISFG